MRTDEVEQLKHQVAALEELLTVYEQSTLEKSHKLEQALEKLRERAQQLEHAQETLQILQSILESMGDGVAVVDEKGKFIFFNPAAEEILDIRQRDNSLKNWAKRNNFYLPDGETIYPEEEYPWQLAVQGEEIDSQEMLLRNASEPEGIWLSVNARPLRNELGLIKGGVVVFRNITTRKMIEESLRESSDSFQEQAEELERTLHELKITQAQLIQTEKMSSLGQLVAGVAHEINNPVNFIYGNLIHLEQYSQDILSLLGLYKKYLPHHEKIADFAEEIELDFVLEDIPQLLSSMKMGSERLRGIVQSLRNFSRLDEAAIKTVDIHEGIDSTIMILQNRLKAKPNHAGIQVIRDYAPLPKIDCYAGQMNQVFMNIISNAIDTLDEKALNFPELRENNAINIRTRQVNGNLIAIHIGDNGLGMSKKVQERIFDPFFTTKDIGKGTGLGMSISYQIVVDNHKGKLHCLSKVGEGTEFVIELAIRQPELVKNI